VASFTLTPASGLASCGALTAGHAGTAGMMVSERSVSMCSVIVRKGGHALLAERVQAEFGVELPQARKTTGAGPVEFIWAGRDQWLAVSEAGDGRALEQRLRSALGPAASLNDQSDGRTVLRLSGPRVRDALAKGVPVDLHPRVFKSADTAMTVVSYINVHLWRVDDAPTYDIAMFRSFAVAFWDWLAAAAAEFGISPKPKP
jgi:heterotetrameric sarcosine oxidase gamma subunit